MYDNDIADRGYPPQKRHGKEDVNALRKRIMELQEDNEMLRAELYKARKKLQGSTEGENGK